ncbi:MAG: PolC-type DNA polymerase III [Lachnospiraceae bacterium]|jgi:DNA polymerase-3 subunit alpha (Gram-positive type)
MASCIKPFKETFRDITLSSELSGLLDYADVERIILNKQKNFLKIYLTSTNWIKKQYIYDIEEIIEKQVFGDMGTSVRVFERFRLPVNYTPENFFELYRSSMELELRKYSSILAQIFNMSTFEFSERSLKIVTPKSFISEQCRKRLYEYFDKVFNERAGFGIEIEISEGIVLKNEKDNASFPGSLEKKTEKNINENGNHKEMSSENPGEDYLINSEIPFEYYESAARQAEPEAAGPAAPANVPSKEGPAPAPAKKRADSRKGLITDGGDVVMGRSFNDEPISIADIREDTTFVVIKGEIFKTEEQEIRSGKTIFTLYLTDYTDSVKTKFFVEPDDLSDYRNVFKTGSTFLFKGTVDYDPFDKEITLRRVNSVMKASSVKKKRADDEADKRIELHCHTKMSDMDAVSSATDIIRQAYNWGHKAIAITDHGVVQAFPEALHTFGGKKGIPKDADFKIIYGMEAYLVDDIKEIVINAGDEKTDAPAVVFSLLTTGTSPHVHDVIELSAVRIENGKVIDTMHTLVNPGKPLPFSVIQLSGISDDMISDAPMIREVIARFADFSSGAVLAAYDIEYQAAFLRVLFEENGLAFDAPYFDISGLVKMYVPGIGRIKMDKLSKQMGVEYFGNIRTEDICRTMAQIYIKLLKILKDDGVEYFKEINSKGRDSAERIMNLPYYHAIILVKNEIGRRNLYRMVSESHLKYFKKRPRIPKSLLTECREGLILGTACSAGELYQAILREESDSFIAKIVNYYDYLEVQPTGNDGYLVREKRYGIESVEDLRNISRRIVKLGEQFNKPVVATCDVHFLNPEDAIYRQVIQVGHGFAPEEQPPLFLHTTREMLEEFSYLGEEKAREIVIDNPELINSMCENISPIHPDKCPPEIPNSDKELEEMCYKKAREIYGEDLPETVAARLKRELTSIIQNGYAVMYIIAQRLVQKSLSDGYLVGSRGSVGSSFVATMASITEVNPLPPHYRCPDCFYSDFDSDEVKAFAGRAGCDMPDKKCPVCGRQLVKDGFDIPFETFLGFKGDKEPDIDLNFSGEEQGVAQAYTEVIFGKGQTFKAGTIGTVKEKTAIGYTKGFFEKTGETKRACEIERISMGCTGIRRTTGQHPGGVIVLPKGMDINWFTPVQHPANDMKSDIITTHFDYHSIDKNLLKLDILGHDDPSMIRMLEDLTGEDPKEVMLDDKGVLSLFSSTEALGISPEAIGGVQLGTLGIPEFGTQFVIGMLLDTKPTTFSELVKISGLSHGTDVWLGNAQELINQGKATLANAICTRDDIMIYLIGMGLEPERAFKTMESVRKGKGLTADMEQDMIDHNVPDWYIWSCKKIKYMFPKAHAVAYVMMAFRIAYYKINYPLAYYAAYFSIRASGFSYSKMCRGKETLFHYIAEYEGKEKKSATEDDILRDMYIVREMYARGFEFAPVDIYKVGAVDFKIVDGKIMPSLSAIDGLGESVAYQIENAAKEGKFLSKEDFRNRTKASKTITDQLDEYGILGEIPESNQISLFDAGLL